jgi:2-polyprenyl-3-methyl-5-hydroxy-6-metoxy-1,4-benzoquinol methylase
MKSLKSSFLFIRLLIALLSPKQNQKGYEQIYAWLNYIIPYIIPGSQDVKIMPGMWDRFPEVSPTKRLLDYVFAYNNPQEGQDILDVGCGLGGLVYYCLEKYPNINSITGIDLLEEHIKKAKQYILNKEKSNFFVSDATQLNQSEDKQLHKIVKRKFHKIYIIDVTQDLTIQQFYDIFDNSFQSLHNQGVLVIHTQTINKKPSSWQENIAVNLLVAPYAPNFKDIKNIINKYAEKIDFEYIDITSIAFKMCLERLIKEKNIIDNFFFYPFSHIIRSLSLTLLKFIKKRGFSEYVIFVKKNNYDY